MDERERDQFYSSPPDEPPEEDELELEPPDPDVLAAEQRRAKESIESTRARIDIEEIYGDIERDRGREILEGWLQNVPRQFQVKHLLIATAVLAILLTFVRLGLMAVLVVGVMLGMAGFYLYIQWQEKKHRDAADRRRQEMYARRRAQLGQKPLPADSDAAVVDHTVAPALPPLPNEVDEIWQQASERRDFQFRFSMQQLLGAMTAAALIFGLVHVLGGPGNAATLLGLVALFGLLVHALGVEPPEVVVLGWWLILVMYVILSVVGIVWSGVS